MDLPIQQRSTQNKPRVVRINGRRYEDKHSLAPRRRPTTWFKCYDNNVAAVGKTIQGAYKNWISLCIERLKGINSLV